MSYTEKWRITELDGLRAVAVTLVLLNHFGPYSLPVLWRIRPVGWVGVDMFFVLSGFLITGILLRTRANPDYYRTFFARRSLRIFPAYYLVLVVTFGAMEWWQHGQPMKALQAQWGSPLWYVFYLANFHNAAVGRGPDTPALVPLWSLQVEEQFYLLFPLLVRRLSITTLTRALGVTLAIEPLWRLALWYWSPANYHLQYSILPSRLDGLCMGALIAIRDQRPWMISRTTLAVATLLTLAAAYGTFALWGNADFTSPFCRIWSYTLFSAAFAGALLWTIKFRGSLATNWLNARAVQYVGKISYGIYLLQGPASVVLFAGFGSSVIWQNDICRFVSVVSLTILLASCSWYLVEKPILAFKGRSPTLPQPETAR